MSALSMWILVALFVVSGAVIWWAGTVLAFTTDAIDAHVGWGEGMGGAVFLAVATNLPEVAIIAGCAYTHTISLAVGNILGGIAIQTAVLVLLDGPGLRSRVPLMSTVTSLTIVLQGMVLVAILMFCIIGALMPREFIAFRMTPAEIAIVVAWGAGLWLVSQNEDRAAWRAGHEAIAETSAMLSPQKHTMPYVVFMFGVAAVTTLLCGVVLALTSGEIAARMHWEGVLFGATLLAAVTALPEVTTGLSAIKAEKFELAISDIIGGNAFLPVLFLFGSFLSGDAILPDAKGPDLYLTALGALLTVVYCAGAVLRSKRLVFGAGVDSVVVLALYIIGIVGLFFIRS
ncbi:MAG: sodium:calcium antiporter [Candidatus Eremiobacteraeota bacterium]|nr:sodium:calcium antiporter [Candidatus Eremiobacteraeota bacterium]